MKTAGFPRFALVLLLLAPASCGGVDAGPVASREAVDPLKEVDLLPLVDLQKDSRVGVWKHMGRALMAPAERYARLDLPYAAPEEYDFKIAVERMQHRTGYFALGLPCGKTRFVLSLEGGDDRTSGLERVDRLPYDANDTTRRKQIFFSGLAASIVCQVRKDQVRVLIDDKPLIEWKSDLSRLSHPPEWGDPADRRPFLGSYFALFRITRMSLQPVSGPGTVAR
jgi:hypothetical protein